MTATKSKARSKTTGRKKTASKAGGKKKPTARKSGKKTTGRSTAKKTAGRKAGASKGRRKSKGTATKTRHADLVTMREPGDLGDMMRVSEFPAADAKLDRVFSNGMKKKTPGKKGNTDFAAWSLNPDTNPKHVGMAIRGHVSQRYKAAREHLSRVPRPVTLFACFLGGFVFGFIARGL